MARCTYPFLLFYSGFKRSPFVLFWIASVASRPHLCSSTELYLRLSSIGRNSQRSGCRENNLNEPSFLPSVFDIKKASSQRSKRSPVTYEIEYYQNSGILVYMAVCTHTMGGYDMVSLGLFIVFKAHTTFFGQNTVRQSEYFDSL